MHGDLAVHVWLPMMSVYEIKEEAQGSQIIMQKSLRHWEGYTPIFPHHCRTIFKSGRVYLREFRCPEDDCRFMLPETADSIRIESEDLVIMKKVKKLFENEHQVGELSICNVKIMGKLGKPKIKSPTPASFDPHFRRVNFNGQSHSFGPIQSSVIKRLYDAAMSGEACRV